MSECTEWSGYANPRTGYCVRTVKNRRVLAHRYAYEQAHGPIPDGMVVMHSCDNRKCINVDHLSVGTYADNSADMVAKGRQHRPIGDRHHNRKIDSTIAEAIRNDPRKQREIAAEYGIAQPTVSDIKRGATWIALKERA